VVAEHREGAILPVSLELLGQARRLAGELGQEVAALLLGHGVESLAPTLIAHGADAVHLAQDRRLEPYLTLPWTRAAAQVIRQGRPEILLVGATPQGRDLAPRLARRLGSGLTADCTGLTIDPQEKVLNQTRPAFGGNVMATIVNRFSRPQMATVRPGVMEALAPDPGRRGRIETHQVLLEPADLKAMVKRTVAAREGRVNLSQAKVVVAGGRGSGGREGFELLQELAAVLGGEVGGTRVAYEEGWIPPSRQIGQTGVSVHPELYIGCGLSGAVQHRAGIMDSRYIVAVNTDPAAPIFEVADFGLVGDLRAVVPALIKAFQGD